MILKIKCTCVICLCAVMLFFTGCTAELEIAAAADGTVSAKYSAGFGAAFKDTLSALSGVESNSVFDGAEITHLFTEAGFNNVDVKIPDDFSLDVSGRLPEDNHYIISDSGILSINTAPAGTKSMQIQFTSEILRNFHSEMPDRIKSYMDLFAAPSFTGEVMTDEEYVDLLAALYGQSLADEFVSAELKLVLKSSSGKQQVWKIPFIKLLNLSENLVFSIEF